VLDSKWAGFDAWDRRGSTSGRGSEVLGIVDGQPSGIDGVLIDISTMEARGRRVGFRD